MSATLSDRAVSDRALDLLGKLRDEGLIPRVHGTGIGVPGPVSFRAPRNTPTVVPAQTTSGSLGSARTAVTGAGTVWRSLVRCQVELPSNHHSVSTSASSG